MAIIALCAMAAPGDWLPAAWADQSGDTTTKSHPHWISRAETRQINKLAHRVLSHDSMPDNRAIQWLTTLRMVKRFASDANIELPVEIDALSDATEEFLHGPRDGDRKDRQGVWIQALVLAVEASAERGVMLNPGFSASSPDLLFALSSDGVVIDDAVTAAIESLFGEDNTSVGDAMYWLDHGQPDASNLGTTVGTVAFLNRKRIERRKKEKIERTQLVIANEGAHIAINRRYPKTSPEKWPNRQFQEELSLSFHPRRRQIREFLSDVISFQVSKYAFEFRLRSIFSGQLIRRDNKIRGNSDEHYGASAELLARSMVAAAEAQGDTFLIVRVNKFLQLAADDNYRAGKRTLKKLDDEEFRARVMAHQVKLGRAVVDMLDKKLGTN